MSIIETAFVSWIVEPFCHIICQWQEILSLYIGFDRFVGASTQLIVVISHSYYSLGKRFGWLWVQSTCITFHPPADWGCMPCWVKGFPSPDTEMLWSLKTMTFIAFSFTLSVPINWWWKCAEAGAAAEGFQSLSLNKEKLGSSLIFLRSI